MQLISLSANQDSFRTVNFKNETGLNFIVASKQHPDSSDTNATTNGVGKSLIVALIHFCLGSRKKEKLKASLLDWSFTLVFKINGEIYKAERSIIKQDIIVLNGEELSVTKFTNKFGDLLFDIPESVTQLTFRSLLPFFIRPRKGSYNFFNNPNDVKNEYQIQATNAFLLGLNVSLSEEKYKLRKEKLRLAKNLTEIKKDKVLKDFFDQKKNSSLESQQIKEDIEKLQKDLRVFDVAEDYYSINTEANKIKDEIEKKENKITLLENQILNIQVSRKIQPDIKKESIENIYREAAVIFQESSLKKLDELEKFYNHLSKNRERRLLDKKIELEKELEAVNKDITTKKKELDIKLKYLNAHHALDIVLKLKDELADLEKKAENIERYDALLAEYQRLKIKTDKDLIISAEKTQIYLDDSKEVTKVSADFFRELARTFYPQAKAGITVDSNSGNNQTRFDIDAKIDFDDSDGIGNIKIFCYDMTILLKGFGHKMDFLFHDSRLLSDTDPRQLAILFKVLDKYIKSSGKQYILTLNQNQIDDVRECLSTDEYERIVTKNICLELKDESPEEKLLGIQVNMDYN